MSANEKSLDLKCEVESFSRVCRVKLVDYSLSKGYDTDYFIELGTFDLAGLSFMIKFFPNGVCNADFISFPVTLRTKISRPLCVVYKLCLLDQNGRPSAVQKHTEMVRRKGRTFGPYVFSRRSDFKLSEYLKDDCSTLHCTLQVVRPSYVDLTKEQVVAPSSDLHQNLVKLLESKDGADLTFEVNGETFVAHKNVLAARSPIFKAQFFGSMLKNASNCVKIDDVKPEVFELMLHFIYTDMLPTQEEKISSEMAQHLLVAADRYAHERLKLISAEILCGNLSVANSATALVGASSITVKV